MLDGGNDFVDCDQVAQVAYSGSRRPPLIRNVSSSRSPVSVLSSLFGRCAYSAPRYSSIRLSGSKNSGK